MTGQSQFSAALLTVGTEVTSGQIVNSNAAWLSDQLANVKIPVNMHLSVPDEERQIIDAISYLAKHCNLIFVTGGLGPTRDDLTRNAVAAWLGQKLIFDEASCQRICQRLNALGIPVAESNRQQCYFPERAKILVNEAGTANAFYVDGQKIKLWCLPGPPKEIARVWQDHLLLQLKELTSQDESWQLRRWQCLGKSESALGEIVESVIAGTELISGYRPHIPYVEIKLWCPSSKLGEYQPVFSRLEEQIAPWIVARDDEDLSQLLLQELLAYQNIEIYDYGSQGIIGERLGAGYRRSQFPADKLSIQIHEVWSGASKAQSNLNKLLKERPGSQLTLALGSIRDDNSWLIGLRYEEQSTIQELTLPYKGQHEAQRERYKRYIVEKSLHQWLQHCLSIRMAKP